MTIRRQVVLVVEDEPLLRLMAVDLVEDAGFEVIEAANADEAIRFLESRADIRVVFSDIDMPGSMDGLELVALVRDRWPPIEVILTSGKTSPTATEMPLGGAFFQKPYRRHEIAATLHRMAN